MLLQWYMPTVYHSILSTMIRIFSKYFLSYLINTTRYILEKDFPGMRIGPEPTTDTFHVVDYAGEVQILHRYCTDIEEILHRCCRDIVQMLHIYCTYIAHILYRYCTDVLMLQRRMVTSLAMYWLLTRRNLTHISKTMGEPFSPGENH